MLGGGYLIFLLKDEEGRESMRQTASLVLNRKFLTDRLRAFLEEVEASIRIDIKPRFGGLAKYKFVDLWYSF